MDMRVFTFIYASANSIFALFYGRVVFHCVYVHTLPMSMDNVFVSMSHYSEECCMKIAGYLSFFKRAYSEYVLQSVIAGSYG